MSVSSLRGTLLYALRRALRPLARLLVYAGVRHEDFADIAKAVYIESAIRDFDFAFCNQPSRERIAALTGLTRSQINLYIDNEGLRREQNNSLMFLVVEVLRLWHTNTNFLGPYGIPLELELESPKGRCFRSLVALADPSANALLVLQELLRTGAVFRSGAMHFRAVSRSVVLTEGLSPQRIEWHANGLSRLAATLEYNINIAHVEKRLERSVFTDRGLAPEVFPQFEKYAREKAEELLLDIDNWLASQDSSHADTEVPVSAGAYVFMHVDPEIE
jgi:hypothetical protein